MEFFGQFRRWASAMDDIEDPRGAELRQVREQVRALATQLTKLSLPAARMQP